MNIRISCIVPTYNRGEVICETVRQLIAQSHPAHEIILMDQTRLHPTEVKDALLAWAQAGTIQWLCQMAPNASMARNTGALIATGEVILFLDDDILMESDFLANHAVNYMNRNCSGVAGQILDGNGAVVHKRDRRHSDPEWDSLNFPKNYAKRITTPWMASGNFSIRRKVYMELGGMDEWYVKGANREESDFAFRFYRSGRLFQFDPNASIYHLGQKLVSGGGCRSYKSVFGGWHHYVGMWYFTVGFAKPSTFIQMAWTHFRSLVLNGPSLRRPFQFVSKLVMFIISLPAAVYQRIKGPKLISRQKMQNVKIR